jgi:hypothetical protein
LQIRNHYFESESGSNEPCDFAADVDRDLRRGAPFLDTRGHARELAAVDAFGWGQTPKGSLDDQDPPQSAASVFEVHAQVKERRLRQEGERCFAAQLHPLMFPEDEND